MTINSEVKPSRKGIGGRPKKLNTLVNQALSRVDQSLPDIFTALINKAIDGDREAQIYLIDRRLGKPKQQTDITTDGQQLGAALIVHLFQILTEKRRELDSPTMITEGDDVVNTIE